MKTNSVVRPQGRDAARLWSAAALMVGLVTSGTALAQDYPSRPITIIVNFAPGAGALNLMVRALADDASRELKQPVVVDYKAGAGGNIGAQFVAGSSPDGYTLLAAVDTTLTVNPSVYAKMPFDADKAFAPIATLATFSQMLVVNREALPVKSFAEFVAYAKSKPVQYASAGNGSPGHVTSELLAGAIGVKLEHIPFGGNAPATQALLGGQVPIGFLASTGVLPHVESGKLTALAVSSRNRSANVPNVPTVAESGYPGFAAEFGWVLLAPAGTPEAVVRLWNAQVKKTLAREDMRARLREWDVAPVASSPAETDERLRSERKRWAEVIKRAGIRGD